MTTSIEDSELREQEIDELARQLHSNALEDNLIESPRLVLSRNRLRDFMIKHRTEGANWQLARSNAHITRKETEARIDERGKALDDFLQATHCNVQITGRNAAYMESRRRAA